MLSGAVFVLAAPTHLLLPSARSLFCNDGYYHNAASGTCRPCSPAGCATPLPNPCDGCRVCSKNGFAPDSNKQCAACTGKQAASVCTTYSRPRESCECRQCNIGCRPVNGFCEMVSAIVGCGAACLHACHVAERYCWPMALHTFGGVPMLCMPG